MRFIAGLFKVAIMILILAASLMKGVAEAEELPDVLDPLFGLRFAASETRFDHTSPDVLARCGIKRSDTEVISWIFAQTQNAQGTFLVLGGLTRMTGSFGVRPWVQDWKGELVFTSGNDCTLIDPPREALMNPEYATLPLSETIVAMIAKDAVFRFNKAFGSHRAFIAALNAQGLHRSGQEPSVLWQTLEDKSLN